MMRPIGLSLVVAILVATTVDYAANEEVEDSDESLNQALLLVNILKSAILRRSQRRFAAMPSALADFASYRPWPPPETPFNGQGPQLRRMNKQDDAGLRKDNNITRQMDYEDPYGPHPGGDAAATAEEATEGSTSPQTKGENNEESTAATKITETTSAKTKTRATNNAQSSSQSDKAKITKAVKKKSIATKKATKMEKSNWAPKKSATTLAKIKKPSKLFTKSRKTSRENFKTKVPTINGGGIIKLKYNKNNKGAIESKMADEAEVAEAAMELQREAGDIVRNRCAMRRTHPGPGRTGPQENISQAPCVGPSCKEANATQVTALRFKATTRIYLSRSVRPQIPLPANNAFCFTNPENALCRTKI